MRLLFTAPLFTCRRFYCNGSTKLNTILLKEAPLLIQSSKNRTMKLHIDIKVIRKHFSECYKKLGREITEEI
jgi:hypothetical protein